MLETEQGHPALSCSHLSPSHPLSFSPSFPLSLNLSHLSQVMQGMNSCDPNWQVYLQRRAHSANGGIGPRAPSVPSPSWNSPSLAPLNSFCPEHTSAAVTPLASEAEGSGLMWEKW